MDLILWRHAEAEAGEPDESRALTSKGRKQAAKMGEWLDRKLPGNCRILSSPAQRFCGLHRALGRAFKTHPSLAPEASVEDLLAAARWPECREPVLIIGHQPTLGRLAALLIAGTEQDWTIRKGSIVWIAQKAVDEAESNYIKVVLGADLVGK